MVNTEIMNNNGKKEEECCISSGTSLPCALEVICKFTFTFYISLHYNLNYTGS